jgi:hypothetical protein
MKKLEEDPWGCAHSTIDRRRAARPAFVFEISQ